MGYNLNWHLQKRQKQHFTYNNVPLLSLNYPTTEIDSFGACIKKFSLISTPRNLLTLMHSNKLTRAVDTTVRWRQEQRDDEENDEQRHCNDDVSNVTTTATEVTLLQVTPLL